MENKQNTEKYKKKIRVTQNNTTPKHSPCIGFFPDHVFYMHVVIFHLSGCFGSSQVQFQVWIFARTQHVFALTAKICDGKDIQLDHRGKTQAVWKNPRAGFVMLSPPLRGHTEHTVLPGTKMQQKI